MADNDNLERTSSDAILKEVPRSFTSYNGSTPLGKICFILSAEREHRRETRIHRSSISNCPAQVRTFDIEDFNTNAVSFLEPKTSLSLSRRRNANRFLCRSPLKMSIPAFPKRFQYEDRAVLKIQAPIFETLVSRYVFVLLCRPLTQQKAWSSCLRFPSQRKMRTSS